MAYHHTGAAGTDHGASNADVRADEVGREVMGVGLGSGNMAYRLGDDG